MKDVPLNDLLPSTDLDKVHKLLTLIFPPPKPKLNLSSLPNLSSPPTRRINVPRFLRRHLDLNISQLAYTPYPAFEHILARDV